MRTIFKYVLAIFIFMLFIFSYFRYTESGQKNAYTILGLYVSYKTGLNIKFKDINITQFPSIETQAVLDDVYLLHIDALVDEKYVDINYTLHSECLKSNVCYFDDVINIKGKANGWSNDLNITGEGKAIGGSVKYSFLQKEQRFENIALTLNDINSSKLSTLLGQKPIFSGKSSAMIHFDYIDEKHKRGKILYTVHDKNFNDINITLSSQIQILDNTHTFKGKVLSDSMTLNLINGTYNQDTKRAKVDYILDVKELAKMKHLLGGTYQGKLHLLGQIDYNEYLKIKGISKDFGGETLLTYKNNTMELQLKAVSLSSFIKLFTKQPTLQAQTSGKIIYHTKTKEIKGKLKLKNAKILASPLLSSIEKKFTPALSKQVFDKSSLDFNYKHHTITSNIILANNNIDFILQNSQINTKDSTINTHIQVKTKKQNLRGKLYVKRDSPKNKNFDNIKVNFKGTYNTLPLLLKTNIDINKEIALFNTHASLSSTDINITKGIYDFQTYTSKAFYTLHTKKLQTLEPLIGKYVGPFSATGEITYNKTLLVRGLSRTFGGMLDFLYKENMLYIDLEKVSLFHFMNLFEYPHMLQANVNGNINYNFIKEQTLIRADLNNTKFLQSDLVETIFKKSGINMRKEIFSKSTLFAIYQHDILAGDLMLKNKNSHFFVKNTQLNTKENIVNARFDLRMQGQEFSGEVHGNLHDPKVKLNLDKLIRYQMDKQLDSVIGKENRELIESMPMGGAAKDVATEMGAGFMEMFF